MDEETKTTTLTISPDLLHDVWDYIIATYDPDAPMLTATAPITADRIMSFRNASGESLDLCLEALSQLVAAQEPTWSDTLFQLLDAQNETDITIYKRAHVDRRLFSKIRSDREYHPSKHTALAFAFALKLPLEETKKFIGRAGYMLTHSDKTDIVVEYFLDHGLYDLNLLNLVLKALGLPNMTH